MIIHWSIPPMAFLLIFGFIRHADGQNAAGANPTQLDVINQRINRIETQLRSLQAQFDVTAAAQRQYLSQLDSRKRLPDQLETDIMKTETDIVDSKFNISNQYFQMFAALLGLLGALGVVAGFIIRRIVTEDVSNKVRHDADQYLREQKVLIEEHFQKLVGQRARLTIATMFSWISFAWWGLYESEYQIYLERKFLGHWNLTSKSLTSNVSIAAELAEAGLDGLDDEKLKELIKTDSNAFLIYAGLKNQWVYHHTAKLICACNKNAQNDDVFNKIVDGAEELLVLSRDQRYRNSAWHELQETSGRALILFGNAAAQAIGRRIIRDLFTRSTPEPGFQEPPREWLAERWAEFFPNRADRKLDLWGLGDIPEPTP